MAHVFEPLTARQQYILGLLIRRYIKTGVPVGSGTLVKGYDLGISSATVRNELARLDELGYLTQLHTSAGRIPTELGYRYFVQRLLGEFELPIPERQMINHQFHQARLDLKQWLRLAAAVLSRTSQGASIVTAPTTAENRYKHIELISTQGRLVLLVFVLYGGEVTQQMLHLAEPVSQIRLSATAERLNKLFAGKNHGDLVTYLPMLSGIEEEIARIVADALQRSDQHKIRGIYREGLFNIVEDEGTRQAVRVLEERSLLTNVLSDVLGDGMRGVQVIIGGDGKWEELRECAIIVSRYGISEQLTGEIAVVGPIRMSYGHNISAVRYVASLMSNFIYSYYREDSL